MTRRATHREGPDPVDLHVGKRMNERRQMLGMSQETLGELTDVTFQQVQKRSTGKNRMGASALYATAQALGVPVQYFFEGLTKAPQVIEDPVFTCKPAMEAARLIYRMDAVAAQHLLAFLRRNAGKPEAESDQKVA